MSQSVIPDATQQPLPSRKEVRVAFLVGQDANVMDTAGPWEVFQDTSLPGNSRPFRLYMVAPDSDVLAMSGGWRSLAHYSPATAPSPHVIVVPAQRSHDASLAWLRQAGAEADLIMSVCTGAFHLARAGLLDGLAATTHHQFQAAFAEQFPQVRLLRSRRFVDNGRVATAAGLTAGIDLALHVVARYFGAEAAVNTARYLEYGRARPGGERHAERTGS